MHTSCNFLSAILYHPSLSAFSIYHPDSGWHVTSSDQGLSFREERAWERGCNVYGFEQVNIFKLGLSFTIYMLYMTMNINEYLKMLGEFAYIAARCMLVK